MAVITPAWMKYVYQENMPLFLKWATRVMGVSMDYEKPERTVLEAIDRLELFFRSLGVPTKLSEVPGVENLDEAVMEKMAKRVRVVHEDGAIGWVKKLYMKDIVEIFKLAM